MFLVPTATLWDSHPGGEVMTTTRTVLDRLKGPVVPVNLCFTEDDALDLEAVGRYVDWLCAQHVPVVLLTYGSSEFMSLTEAEIWSLTERVGRAVAGRALFIASTGWWPPARCRDFLRHAEQSGADAVKVQIHPWLGARREVLVGYFDAVQDATTLPLLVWGNWPPPCPVDVVAELARRPRIVGMKNDSDQFYGYYDLIRATRNDDFAVISGGQMRNFAFGYPLGSPAYLCTVAPFRPDVSLRFYGALQAGQMQQAWEIVFRFEEPWLKLAEELSWLPSIKSALQAFELYPNRRLPAPARSHTQEEFAQIRRTLEEVFGPLRSAGLAVG
jgi:dihydrodipicolinate synthase/N-acetylneuraminate lyase